MLKIDNAVKIFSQGTPNEHKALNSLSLNLKRGEFVTIVGSNGAGKSTMFNAICGNFLLDSGKIEVDGKDITFMKEHKRAAFIGRVFQDPMKGTAPNMTIEENLALAYSRSRRGPLGMAVKKSEKEIFKSALTPKLLLLDEHTAALDPATAEKVMEITNKIVKRNELTTLMITHNMNSALKTGNRTIMMDSGEIILDVSGEEREKMTLDDLLNMYSLKKKEEFANDRMLLG